MTRARRHCLASTHPFARGTPGPPWTRRAVLRGLGAGAVGLALVSTGCNLLSSPTPPRLVRLGQLSPATRERSVQSSQRAFIEGLRQYGWIEGENFVLEWRSADGHNDRYAALAMELVHLPVDMLVIGAGTAAVLAAKQATTTIPIVFINLPNPIRTGIVESLARPGANLTGNMNDNPELAAKRLSVLHEALPGVSTVGFLRNPDNPAHDVDLMELRAAAQDLTLRIIVVDTRAEADFEAAVAAGRTQGVEALLLTTDSVHSGYWARMADVAQRGGLPIVSYSSTAAQATGALAWYGPAPEDTFRRGAYYVDRILRGASPADLPVEAPTLFHLGINAEKATALGITISPALAAQVTEWAP